MKKIIAIGMGLAGLLGASLAFAAGPANAAQGGMQQEQKAMGQHAMEKKSMKMVHHRFSSEQVKAIQQALNANGAKLMVDGRWGKDTRDAIKAFQKGNALRITGYANKKTRGKLGLKF